MDFKTLIARAKVTHRDLKNAVEGRPAAETRFLVQFKDALTIYQYKADAEGMAKLAKVNFDEVIMIQMAIGNSVKVKRYTRFVPEAVAMLHSQELYIVPSGEIPEDAFNWE